MKHKAGKTAQQTQQNMLNLQRNIIFLHDLESLWWNRVSCNALKIHDIQGRKK